MRAAPLGAGLFPLSFVAALAVASPVAAQGPPGTLDGTGFRLEEKGAVVIFTGPARMVLVPAEGEK